MTPVKELLRQANEMLAKKHGIDPLNPDYVRQKNILIYAWEHGIDVKDVAAHKKGKRITTNVNNPTPPKYMAAQDIEKQLGRPLRTESASTSSKKPVQNPLTGEWWPTVIALCRDLGTTKDILTRRINKKQPLNGIIYEYAG